MTFAVGSGLNQASGPISWHLADGVRPSRRIRRFSINMTGIVIILLDKGDRKSDDWPSRIFHAAFFGIPSHAFWTIHTIPRSWHFSGLRDDQPGGPGLCRRPALARRGRLR